MRALAMNNKQLLHDNVFYKYSLRTMNNCHMIMTGINTRLPTDLTHESQTLWLFIHFFYYLNPVVHLR